MGAIYSILNKESGKIYVGQSVRPQIRKNDHFNKLNKNIHSNQHLQNAFNRYGEDAFEFNILENCSNDKLDSNEIWWISYFDATNREKGYNITPGGDSNPMEIPEIVKKAMDNRRDYHGENNPFYGKSHSDKTKQKIRDKVSGKKSCWYGKSRSLENKINVSKSHSSTGIFRVTIIKKPKCKQGFMYEYRYYDEDGKRKAIASVNLDKLKKKVLSKGLDWVEMG